MSHLDEGTLHAYLDNQLDPGTPPSRQEVESHLAECPQCRALLEDARRLRDQAQGILSGSGPRQVAVPPFADVLARAAGRRTRGWNRPLTVLAWAASLALAVTLGWYARSQMTMRTSAGAGEAAGPAEKEEARAAGIQARPPAPQQVAQAAPPRAEAARRQPAESGLGAVPPVAGVAARDRPIADVAAAEAKAAVEAPAPAIAPAPVMRRSEPRQVGLVLAGEAWVTVTPAQAERRLGGPVASIPGLPSLGIWLSGAGESVVARTIQVLGPGQTIELVQQRGTAPSREQAAAPAAIPEAKRAQALPGEPGLSVTVQWEGFSVTGRALVPADSLRKLLQRLTPLEPLR